MISPRKTAGRLTGSICRYVLSNPVKIRPLSRSESSNATTETLEPVTMSYASYESSAGPNQAPPLIIMHGLFGSKGNWNSLCKVYNQKTSPSRKIVAIDARNHGDSAHSQHHTYAHLAADIRALYDQLEIEKASLMGHSMGGRAVMMFSLKYPELVDKLIVADISPCSTSPNLDSMPGIFRTLETVSLPGQMPTSQARAHVDAQLAKTISDKGLRSFLLTNLVEKNGGSYDWRINVQGLLANFNNVTRFPLINDLTFKGPVLFVAGGNSDFVQKSDYPKILKLFPKAEMKFIEGAGHWLHSEKPAEFLSVTLDFLNRKEH